MSLKLEEITDTEGLEQLWPEWSSLWEACPAATPFQSPSWLLPWWHHLFGGGKLWALALRSEGRLVGLAPLFIYGYGSRPEVRRVTLLGAGVSDYLDFLIEDRLADAGMAAVLQFLVENETQWEVCDFPDLPARSPLLTARVPESFAWDDLPGAVCPVLPLPQTFTELESRLDREFRVQLRRASNRVRSAGAEFETAAASNLSEMLDALFRLHANRWHERGEDGVLSTRELQDFHREAAARMLERGYLRMYGLRLAGDLIAVQYNFVGHGRVYAYLSGFDPELARLSPGMVLLRYAIEQAIDEQLGYFDFLRDPEPFKHRWGAEDRPSRRVTIRHAAAQTGYAQT